MKILMVCLGNICRSPLAEGILRSKISDKHTVKSAGTISFHEGEHPDKRSIKTAKEHGIDISHQRANYFLPKNIWMNLIRFFAWMLTICKMYYQWQNLKLREKKFL